VSERGERPGVVLALSPIAERQIESLLFDHEPPLELLSSVAVADELPREVQQRSPEAVLLSPELSGLTQGHCERVRAAGTRLVGLALDQHERDMLDALGVDVTIGAEVSREELLSAVGPRSRELHAAQNVAVASSPPVRRAQQAESRGSVVAVLGVRGAPGASELAASLAASSMRQWATVLVETDALGGSLAARLGVDPGDGSITGLIRATQAGESGLRELVERWLIQPDGWPLVLLGPSDPRTIGELAKPGVVTAALDALASLYPVVVCDVSFLLTDGQQQPVHLHREALINADAVLLVLGPRESQLHAGLRQLDLLLDVLGVPAERVRIIVGQVGGPSSADKRAITNTIASHLADRGLAVDAWLPWDARGAKRAEQQGRPIALARRHGTYARTVKRLLDELFVNTTAAPKTKRRKHRLPAPVQTGTSEHDEVVWQR
jgi:Flp pilus assembly CpaE family ATPase